jgi:hypothetical protein
MKVYLLIDKGGQVRRVHSKKEQADLDLELLPEGKVTEFEVIGSRERQPRTKKAMKVTAGA